MKVKQNGLCAVVVLSTSTEGPVSWPLKLVRFHIQSAVLTMLETSAYSFIQGDHIHIHLKKELAVISLITSDILKQFVIDVRAAYHNISLLNIIFLGICQWVYPTSFN